MEIVEKELTDNHALVKVRLTVEFKTGIVRRVEALGVCERWEIGKNNSLHNLLSKRETRAIKRAIETIFKGRFLTQSLGMLENQVEDKPCLPTLPFHLFLFSHLTSQTDRHIIEGMKT